jgi:rhamnosyltransferase subunit B
MTYFAGIICCTGRREPGSFMNFLFAPIGSLGDVNPYLGIGRRLNRRGHAVTILANPHFESIVGEAGLGFVPVGTAADLEEFADNPDIWRFRKGWRLALRWGALGTMRALYHAIARHYRPGNTVVAGPGMAFGARLAQEKLGVPLATIHLEPDKIRSLYRSPKMPPPLVLADWVPRLSKHLQLGIADRWFVDPVVAPEVNRFRGELGLPPVRRVVADWWHSPDRVLGLFPDWYCPPQPDWPPQVVLTGFPLWRLHDVSPLPEEAARFLDEGPSPIVFTAGSAHRHAHRFYQAAAECCRLLGRRGMLVTKYRHQVPHPLPKDVRWFEFVPFDSLLPRTSALVSHGGVGTIALGLAAGIPQVLLPMSFNQPDDAARVARLGAGVVLGRGRYSAKAMARAVDRLLSTPQVARRCRELATLIAAEGSIERAVDALESFAARYVDSPGSDADVGGRRHLPALRRPMTPIGIRGIPDRQVA